MCQWRGWSQERLHQQNRMEGRGHLIVENAGVRDSGGGHYLEIRFNSKVALTKPQLFLTVEPEDDYQLVTHRRYLRIEGNLSLATNAL